MTLQEKQHIIDEINATMSMSGMPLTDENKQSLMDILDGKITYEESLKQKIEKHRRPQTMTLQEKQYLIDNVNATMTMSGMPLADEDKQDLEDILDGKISYEESIQKTIEKYKERVVR